MKSNKGFSLLLAFISGIIFISQIYPLLEKIVAYVFNIIDVRNINNIKIIQDFETQQEEKEVHIGFE